jgi:trimeric autotransporter adhesin
MKSLPRPPAPKIAQSSAIQQQPMTADSDATAFQAADITDLPGLTKFQQEITQTGTDATTSVASRSDNLLMISGNAVSLDAGNMNDAGFRREIMDMAQRMGFQMQESGPVAGGSFSNSGGGPGGGGPGGGGPGGGGPGGGGMGFMGMAGRAGRGMNYKPPIVQGNINETYSNSALNARSYSLNGQTVPKSVTIRNNYSLTLGGNLPFTFSSPTSGMPAFSNQRAATGAQPSGTGVAQVSPGNAQGSTSAQPATTSAAPTAPSSAPGTAAAQPATASAPKSASSNSQESTSAPKTASASQGTTTARAASSGGRQGSSFGRGRQPTWSFTYSGNRNRNSNDTLTTVPTDLERTGDFSQTLVQALTINPLTGERTVKAVPVQLYSNPNDPSSRFTQITSVDPIAKELLNYFPKANMPCAADAPCVKNYFRQQTTPSSSNQFQVTISGLRLTSKDNFSVNYSTQRQKSQNASIFPGLSSSSSGRNQSIGINGNRNFASRLTMNWRFNLNRTTNESTNAFAYVKNVEGDLGITGVSKDPINWGPPTISLLNHGSLSLANPNLNKSQNLTFSVSINKMGRKHSIRSGFDFTATQRNSYSDSNGRGTFTFNGSSTDLHDSLGRQVSGTGYDLADFLLGLASSTSRRYVDSLKNPYGRSTYLRSRSWNFFIMDNWQFRSNLTINYGLRYEYTGPTYEKYNRLVSLDADPYFTSVAQVFPDQKGSLSGKAFPRSIVSADRNNFAPRIGIAWKPTKRSPFVINTGYSIGYSTDSYSSMTSRMLNQAPFAVNQNLIADNNTILTFKNGFPTIPTLTILNNYAIDPYYKAPYAQQWNLEVQARLSQLYSLTVAYNGTKGTNLDITRIPNRATNASLFQYQTNGANLSLNAMNVQFSRRYSHGFSISSSYTLSKSIDDCSGSGSGFASAPAQNDAYLRGERGLSNSDQRHNFQVSYGYELPFGKNRYFFKNSSDKLLNFISGWNFNGSMNLASGSPLTVYYASTSGLSAGAGLYNSLRADVTGVSPNLPKSDRTLQRFFNTAAYSIPAGTYGTSGRNSITGPGSKTMNLSVRKAVTLDESGRSVDISWQVQNLLNHPNWGGVNTTVNSINFGQVTNVRGMRSMTANVRVRF